VQVDAPSLVSGVLHAAIPVDIGDLLLHLLNAEQYGVPQTRRRAILIANLEHEVSLPTPTHSKYYNRTPEKLDEGVQKWVSMAEALGRGMTHRPSMTATGGGTGRGGAEPFDNGARKSMRRGIEAGRWVTTNYLRPNGTVRNEDEPAPTTTGSKDFGERRWLASPSGVTGPVHRPIEEPAATVTGKGNYYAYPEGYKDQSVRVSVEDAAILQTFPADYPWQGTKSKQFQQIGNAIPPLLAEAILKEAVR
jgi:DNA (cytosine-5)-methyltransferase 1